MLDSLEASWVISFSILACTPALGNSQTPEPRLSAYQKCPDPVPLAWKRPSHRPAGGDLNPLEPPKDTLVKGGRPLPLSGKRHLSPAAPFAARLGSDLRNAPRATGSRGGGEAATFPPPSNRRAWVRRPRWGPAPRLPWSGSPAGAGREAGGGWGSAGRTRGASCSPPAPPDVAKANNRGDAEKQKAIRHDPHGLCGVVLRGGHLGGGQEGG